MQILSSTYDVKNIDKNKLNMEDRRFHDWYRFVLSFPPHLVKKYIQEFKLSSNDVILDPFCGTGTTLIEAKLSNIPSIGLEANPFIHLTSEAKTNWSIDSSELLNISAEIKNNALEELSTQCVIDEPFNKNINTDSLRKLSADQEKLILKNSISPIPLHKSLVLLKYIEEYIDSPLYKYLLIAFANVLVFQTSNLRFGPEVGVGKHKLDVSVIEPWFKQIIKICNDIEWSQSKIFAESESLFIDSRNMKDILSNEISAVITSPPYPNEKDYTRTTRLESVLLGFINSKEELRALKKTLLRSNTRGVYKNDDDDKYVKNIAEVQNIANEIEERRLQLGKTSGFERLYHKVTKLYFGGIAKHLFELQSVLKPNAHLAYVVGDQASYLRVMIRTGSIIAEIAQTLGYEYVRTDLFRTRFSTATKSDLNEEVVILKWVG